jgi:hypothetical protein
MPARGQPYFAYYYAFNTSTKQGQPGDAGNHTLAFSRDGSSPGGAPNNAPFEVDGSTMPGVYALALDAAETDFASYVLGGVSSTADVVIEPVFIGFDYLPHAAPGEANGFPILGTNNAGIKLAPATGHALDLAPVANGSALNMTGAATGNSDVVRITGGPNTHGVRILMDAAASNKWGFSIQATASAGHCIQLFTSGAGAHGIYSWATGAGANGIEAVGGGANGIGIDASGVLTGFRGIATTGPGVRAQGTTFGFQSTASAGSGATFTGTTTGVSITTSGSSSPALDVQSGAAAQPAVRFLNTSTGEGFLVSSVGGIGTHSRGATAGVQFEGTADGYGAYFLGSQAGEGLRVAGGNAANGAVFTRGHPAADDLMLLHSDAPTLSAAVLADGSIKDATFVVPDEAAGRPAGFLGMMRRVFEASPWGNRRVRNRTSGTYVLRTAADDADLVSVTQSTTSTGTDTVDQQSQGA